MNNETPVVNVVVNVGQQDREYTQGDLLNSIDQVVKYFREQRQTELIQIVDALEIYIKDLER